MIYLLTVYVMLLFVDSFTLSCGIFVIMLLKTVNLHKSQDVNMLIFLFVFLYFPCLDRHVPTLP